MRAEIITIGEEILSGQTVDTNGAFISRKLAEIGIEVGWKTSVGDQAEEITSAIKTAWRRAHIILATGGLGPTADDITKKAICSAFERKLVLRDEILQELQRRYDERGLKMPALVQNQALQPQGAELIENRTGSAVGITFRDTDRYFVAMPGVPSEMEAMLIDGVLPQLRELPGREHIEIKLLRTVGITESQISELITDLQSPPGYLKLAFLPDYKGVDLRITGKGHDTMEVRSAVDRYSELLMERIGDYIFTVGEDSLIQVVSRALIRFRATVSTAESCTGGLLAKMLTDIPGSSNYFQGSVVAYSNELKNRVLKVPRGKLEKFGAVSSQVAEAMASGIRKLTGTDFAISTTGIAGPDGGTPEKPVGLVYVGLAHDGGLESRKLNLTGARERVRERTCLIALDMLRRRL